LTSRDPITPATADTASFIAFTERVRLHTNGAHQHELCHYVAARTATPVETLAGVTMTQLDAYGAELRWVDATGGRQARLAFAEEAHSIDALAIALGMNSIPPGNPVSMNSVAPQGNRRLS
jgi:hypothetical protein